MIVPPCKGCKERTIPKTCEKTCPKWQEFRKQKKIEKANRDLSWYIEKRIDDNIWRYTK